MKNVPDMMDRWPGQTNQIQGEQIEFQVGFYDWFCNGFIYPRIVLVYPDPRIYQDNSFLCTGTPRLVRFQ